MTPSPTIDLRALPERRRRRVEQAYRREVAAERIRAVYPTRLALHKEAEAMHRTAEVVRSEGFGFVTARFVRAVIREGR